jgi:hypothetical protein
MVPPGAAQPPAATKPPKRLCLCAPPAAVAVTRHPFLAVALPVVPSPNAGATAAPVARNPRGKRLCLCRSRLPPSLRPAPAGPGSAAARGPRQRSGSAAARSRRNPLERRRLQPLARPLPVGKPLRCQPSPRATGATAPAASPLQARSRRRQHQQGRRRSPISPLSHRSSRHAAGSAACASPQRQRLSPRPRLVRLLRRCVRRQPGPASRASSAPPAVRAPGALRPRRRSSTLPHRPQRLCLRFVSHPRRSVQPPVGQPLACGRLGFRPVRSRLAPSFTLSGEREQL